MRAMQMADVIDLSDRRVTELSGGERCRVALARVLAVEAPVLLADEPTASLDPRHQIEILKKLRATADKDVLVIVVTHDLGLAARFADFAGAVRRAAGVAGRAGRRAVGAVMANVFRINAYRAEYQREASSCRGRKSMRLLRLFTIGCRRGAGSPAVRRSPRSAAYRVDEHLHRSIAAGASRSPADPGIEPVLARLRAVSGQPKPVFRSCPAAPRTFWCSSPMS